MGHGNNQVHKQDRMEMLQEPFPERMANLVFPAEGTVKHQRALTIGIGRTLRTLSDLPITPVHEIYLIIDDTEFAIPVSMLRGLLPRLEEFANVADALNKEGKTHG